MRAGGHHNIEINPVFRGMVRAADGGQRAFNQRKNL
jgi:hypothetical protein